MAVTAERQSVPQAMRQVFSLNRFIVIMNSVFMVVKAGLCDVSPKESKPKP